MGLHAQIAHRPLAGGKGNQILIEHLPDQIQRLIADARVPFPRVQNGHQHDRPGLFPGQRLSHGAGVRADDVLLQGGGVFGGDGVADIFTKAGCHPVDDPALLQKLIQKLAVGPDGLLQFGGKFNLRAVLGHCDKLLQRQHAVGDAHGRNGAGLFDREIHDLALPFLFH